MHREKGNGKCGILFESKVSSIWMIKFESKFFNYLYPRHSLYCNNLSMFYVAIIGKVEGKIGKVEGSLKIYQFLVLLSLSSQKAGLAKRIFLIRQK